MAKTPPDGMQRVIPYLTYSDAPKAIDFLCRAFGFEERFRFPMPDGRLGHAELACGDNVLMLASAFPEIGMASPQELPALHGQVMCYVDDVDAHCARAREAGATVVGEPEDQPHGDRSYRAVDPEGHRWIFATHVRDVPTEEWIGADYEGELEGGS
ncbi:MAG: VOC family protein [Myxococcota bacterium]|nr:VOC family protein [Myxococcota bacterium]